MDLNIFDLIIVQPIFNLLLFIQNFVGDFGIAIIILTIIIRFLLFPLVRKQMRQTKLMRECQPELKNIKKKCKGNRMLESQMTMALYKERGVKPFSSILVLLIQLPIFIAVFMVIRKFAGGDLGGFAYPFMENFDKAWTIIQNPESFAPSLFGIVDLTTTAFANGPYWPLIIIALIAAGLQFYQTRQTNPQMASGGEKKKISEYFKDAAAGKEVDQSEMSAAMTKNMMYFFPILTLIIAINLPGAVVLYFAAQAAVAVGQQAFLLKYDKKHPVAAYKQDGEGQASIGDNKRKNAKEAIVVKKSDLKKQTEGKPLSGGQTIVRRIKAK